MLHMLYRYIDFPCLTMIRHNLTHCKFSQAYELGTCLGTCQWYIATTHFRECQPGFFSHTYYLPAEFYSVWRVCNARPKKTCPDMTNEGPLEALEGKAQVEK